MTADDFEKFDELEAEVWIARRYQHFVRWGYPPELSLMFAVHPEIELSAEAQDTEVTHGFDAAA